MYLNDIDFPNKIIDSIQDRNLVVFAGAGASVDPPTSLPNFEKLAGKIAEGTGYTLKKKDSCEVFLGMLKSKGIPVNEQAANILSGTCVEHNKLHEAIIGLFPDAEDIKIITTNYDQMFEHVLDSRAIKYKIYNAPALPLGNDVQGIIHIHGNVNNPDYMVVTDEDFGKAYLTEGYASRFLVKLFESYTVLFVGYSYSDTILRYLTRAMSRSNSERRYILTDDKKSDWSALGINPIWFPKRRFATMREGLNKLGAVSRKGLLDWKKQLSEISEEPPKDLTIDTEIDYCLENIERTRVLCQCIHGTAWISFLDKKKAFDGCFSNVVKLTEQDTLWANWLCDNFVGKEDDHIFRLIYVHNNCISDGLSNLLSQKLIRNKGIADEVLSEYVVLLEATLKDPWLISRLIEDASERKNITLAFRLYKKLLACRLTLQSGWLSKDSFDYEHTFTGSFYDIQHSWALIKGDVCKALAYEVMLFAHASIEDIHNQYVLTNKASKDSEPWKMSMLIIEDREEESYREDVLEVLAQMYSDAALCLMEQDCTLLKNVLYKDVKSESYLLKKMALKAIRVSSVFESTEILDLVINNGFLDCRYIKEQVFLLVASTYKSFNSKERGVLLDAIEALADDNADRTKVYIVYNWCIWLLRIDGNNERVNNIVNQLHSQYGFEPRKHPELDIETSSAVWIPDKSPLTEQELKQLDLIEAAIYIRDYKEDPFEGPNRYGLLKALETCITNDYLWARSFISVLIEQKISNEDIWQHVFYGLENTEASIDEFINMLNYLTAHVADFGYDKEAARLLYKIVRREDMKDSFAKYEKDLFSASEIIWKNRDKKIIELNRCIDLTLNTTIGIIVSSWIIMISYTKELIIPEQYKLYFEKALKQRTAEKRVSVCILAGYFNFLCYRDKDWCIERLVNLLSGSNKMYFSCAWEGFSFFSGRINKDTVDILSPVFFKALKHIDWLEDEAKYGFIELLLTLLIHVIDKPTLKFIPAFYKSASESDVKQLIHAIEGRLRNLDETDKMKWWNNWLKHFIDNRKNNKPVLLSETEHQALFSLLPELDFVFDDAIQIMCKGKMPDNIDGMLWHYIEEKQLASRFPQSTAVLITKVLNSCESIGYERVYIRKIVNEIKGIDDKTQRKLQEALLKKGI